MPIEVAVVSETSGLRRSSAATRPMEMADDERDLAERSCCNLNTAQWDRVTEMLAECADVLAKSPEDLGRINLTRLRIDKAKHNRQAARRLPINENAEAQTEKDVT